MFKFLKKIFLDEQPTISKVRNPLKKKLHKNRIKRRKALRRNKVERRSYREASCKWVVPKTRKKKYYRPQDATNTWYYRYLQRRK